MALTDVQIRNTKPCNKPQKLFDGGGLFLLVTPSGGRWWRLKYRFEGKEKLLSLGVYPEVPLAGRLDKNTNTWINGARDKREQARQLLASGIDPGAVRKAEKAARAGTGSFEAVAREWHAKQIGGRWTEATAADRLARLEADVFPQIGNQPINRVSAPDLLAVLSRVESRGAIDIARRLRQMMGQIFRYAIATGRAERDPAVDLRDALPPENHVHHAAVTDPKGVGALMRAIEGYQGEAVTRAALRLAPLVFVRPGELRAAEWSEIDLDGALWRIPAIRMKMKQSHLVPLSRQAVAILRELHPFTGTPPKVGPHYVFPSVRTRARPMSENTINSALRRLGYAKNEMTGHGFRTTASTLLNEMGWHRDAIERQLAHAARDAVRGAYNVSAP